MRNLCCAMLLVVCASAQTERQFLYRVDDHVYRGKQPKKEDCAKLAKMDIKAVLDLRGGFAHKPWEQTVAEAAGLHYVRIGLSGIVPHCRR